MSWYPWLHIFSYWFFPTFDAFSTVFLIFLSVHVRLPLFLYENLSVSADHEVWISALFFSVFLILFLFCLFHYVYLLSFYLSGV